MQTLLGKTQEDILLITQKLNIKSFVAKQICHWLYKKNVINIDEMSNIAIAVRKKLKSDFIIGYTPFSKEVISKDGTRKYLFQYDDLFIEAVLIFDNQRVTLCISSQAGCKMNCDFCATGKQGFYRNLNSNEILNIFATLNQLFPISNIVFMGMGEPLDNFAEIKKVLDILTSEWGYGLSPRRITLSTAGYLKKLKEFIDSTQVDLAISLHNPISSERQAMMPIEKAYKIESVINLLRQYDWKGQRHLTFEYIVFDNLNSDARHVNALAQLLNGLKCRINLIRFHSIPNTQYKGVSDAKMKEFAQQLKNKGFNVTIRASKGEDISAACGLLSTKEMQKNIKIS